MACHLFEEIRELFQHILGTLILPASEFLLTMSTHRFTDMDSCQVFVFGDMTIPFEEDFRQLLHKKESQTLSSFFDQVCFRLRESVAELPSRQQKLLPRFTTLVDLLSSWKDCEGAPALRFALVCIYQVGQFVRFYGEGSRHFPKAANSYLLGTSTGSFAAAAISVSQTISQLVTAGAEAVLVAFKTGLCSLELRDDLEKPTADGPRSWSVVVNSTEAQATEIIKTFNSAKSLPRHSRPYLSVSAPESVVISGPPSVLEELSTTQSLTFHHLPIECPYHAPFLSGLCNIDEIMGQLNEKSIQSLKPQIALISAASGTILSARDFKTLLRIVVSEILGEPIQWDRILQSFSEKIFPYTKFRECVILPVPPGSGHLLHSKLSQNTEMNIVVSDFLSPALLNAPLSRPTGVFEHSKIAIIGYSGRFPDCASHEDFWELLHAGRDVHRTIPEDRFDWKAHFDATGRKKNTNRVPFGCFINEPGLFDASFFNMSPRESRNTDPAARLAIMTTYEALEMAGIVINRTPSTQQDRVGVFFGTASDDWREAHSSQDIDTYFLPGGNRAFVPGRISYFFRLCGPSLNIDAACSSSFVAIQTACSHLWRGDIDTAIAGGTTVLTSPDKFAGLDRGHFLSTTGNCNTFDDGASGYCRADAVGSVVLKRLEDAQADNDPIFGIIAGAATNHCGHTDSITRPHEGDQASLFARVLRHANVNPLDISYIEMHGTGTQRGDATEMKSVLSTFAPDRERMPHYPLYIGTAKPNVGHSEAASGVCSLIKVLIMMKKNVIPPHIGIKTKINRNFPLDLGERNVNIALQPVPWHRTDSVSGKRTVFLNNFNSTGGTTVVLLEDVPLPKSNVTGEDNRTMHVVTVTAKCATSWARNIDAMINFLGHNPNTLLPALSYTTTARRMHYSYRTIVSGSDIESIREALKIKVTDSDVQRVPDSSKIPGVVFVFNGQGSAYTGIGKKLYENVAHFRSDMQRFDHIAQQQGFPSFIPLVDGSATNNETENPVLAHLALTCVQMALSRLWASWGVVPLAAIGHSLGEYAALYAVGTLMAGDVIYLVGTRAQLLSRHCSKDSHSMLAVKASLDIIKSQLAGSSCEIACINQPESYVLSGPMDEISNLKVTLQSLGYLSVTLNIPYAFHSAQVDPILREFETVAANVRFNAPLIPYMSPLLAKIVSDGGTLRASYLAQACRNLVNFQGALEAAKASSIVDERTLWLEIGSHTDCSSMIKHTLGERITTLASLKRNTDTWKSLTGTLESLYLNGIGIQWNEYHRDFKSSHSVIELPQYQWDLKNYWIQYNNNFCLLKGATPALEQIGETAAIQKIVPFRVSSSVQRILEEHNAIDVSTLLAESDIHDPRLFSVFQGHKVNGVALCPSSLYTDIAMTVASYMLRSNKVQSGDSDFDIVDMKVERPLMATSNKALILQISACAKWTTNDIQLAFYSVNAQGKKSADHATCKVRIATGQAWLQEWERNSYLIKSRIKALHDGVDYGNSHKLKRGIVYKLFSAVVDYSPKFQGMQEVVLDSDELEATAKVSFCVGDEGFYSNPCWLDSLGHIAGFIMNGNDLFQSRDLVFINRGWDMMRRAKNFAMGEEYQSYSKMQLVSGTMYSGNTYILEKGNIIAIYEEVKFQGVPRQTLDHLLPSHSSPVKAPSNNAVGKPRSSTQSKLQSATHAATGSKSVPSLINTPPTENVVTHVMRIISEESGLEMGDLDPSSEFTSLGVDSLLSLTIRGRIQEEMKLELSSTILEDCPTVNDLTSLLNGSQSGTTLLPPSRGSDSSSTHGTDTSSEGNETNSSSVTANDYIIEFIHAAIAQETGVATEELKSWTSFSELGMDSLLKLTIMGKFREGLNMEFPASLLDDNDTIDEVEKALDLNKGPSGDGILTNVKNQLVENGPDSPPHATSVLLQGNPRAAKTTLFLFPEGSGSAVSYSSIPRISPDVAVYGLNSPWHKKPEDMSCSFVFACSKYVVEILRRQPQGPYYLGGWSAGGICAYETAQQLARQGSVIARLILLDVPNPIGLQSPRLYDFLDSLNVYGTKDRDAAASIRQRAHFTAFSVILDGYRVRPFAGPPLQTLIVCARDGLCKSPSDARPEVRPDDSRDMLWIFNNRTDFSGAGWDSLVGVGNLTVCVLDDVNHFSMLAPGPKAQELSAFIERAMQ